MKNILKKKNYIIIILLQIVWIRCASVATPTGGKKDEIPPTILKTVPINLSRDYKGQIIELLFDEVIIVENLKQELLITPGIEGNYEFERKKDRLSLRFEKPFQPNTTYTLNFRNAIKDITEKNVVENAKIVFSTGDVIDSLFIKGNVKELLTNKPKAEVSVMLHKISDTLDVKNSLPYYVTKTDKEGNYLLEYLKSDNYQIYALSEKNNNLKYDNVKEEIAFLKDDIQLDSNISNLNFKIVSIDKELPRLLRSSPELEYYNLEFNEGLSSAILSVPDSSTKLYYQIKQDKNIRIYNSINKYDSIPIIIQVSDSSENQLKKELKIKFNEDNKSKREKFTVETTPKEGEEINKNLEYTIKFNKPIGQRYLNRIELLADTLTPIPIDTIQDMKWNNFNTALKIVKNVNVNKNLRVKIPEGTFMSIEGDTSKVIISTHEIKDPAKYGLISGTINTSESNFIVQLLNNENKVVAEQINSKNYKFQFLQAGKYTIRVIIDKNKNGKWDNGNLQEKILPEEIIFFDGELNLKQNWDLTENDITI